MRGRIVTRASLEFERNVSAETEPAVSTSRKPSGPIRATLAPALSLLEIKTALPSLLTVMGPEPME